MSTFKVGDRVRCINNEYRAELELGREYTVSDASDLSVQIGGVPSRHMNYRFELAGEEMPLPPPFGELRIDDRVALFVASQNGKAIQQWYLNSWRDDHQPTWWPTAIYRIKPDEAIPDSFDWSHAKFNYVARDGNGDAYGYVDAPAKRADSWVTADDEHCSLEFFTSYKKGNLPWDQSLICRPGYEVK